MLTGMYTGSCIASSFPTITSCGIASNSLSVFRRIIPICACLVSRRFRISRIGIRQTLIVISSLFTDPFSIF